jgi:hypothetical protein
MYYQIFIDPHFTCGFINYKPECLLTTKGSSLDGEVIYLVDKLGHQENPLGGQA